MTKRKKDKLKFPTPEAGSAAEKIKRRRLQVLVHSCMYYELDQSIVDDDIFDGWCNELVELQKDNPGVYSDRFDEWFDDFTGETGFNLPLRDPWVYGTAKNLLDMQDQN